MDTENRRIRKGVERGQPFEILVDGEKTLAYKGETVGAVLLAAGKRTLRYTNKGEQPRGIFCGIGLCQECRMVINGIPDTQACLTLATPGCTVETQPSNRNRRV